MTSGGRVSGARKVARGQGNQGGRGEGALRCVEVLPPQIDAELARADRSRSTRAARAGNQAAMAIRRADRLSKQIQDELSSVVRRELKDPRVGAVTFTGVDLSADLREATVRFLPMGGADDTERIAELQSGLNAACAFLQGKVGRNLRLRFTPRFSFKFDKGVANLLTVHDLLEGLKQGAASDSDKGDPS